MHAALGTYADLIRLLLVTLCCQDDEARAHPHLIHNAFLKSKSSIWEERGGERRLDFEITQYAPLMFRTLREIVFGLSREGYSLSLCSLLKMKSGTLRLLPGERMVLSNYYGARGEESLSILHHSVAAVYREDVEEGTYRALHDRQLSVLYRKSLFI